MRGAGARRLGILTAGPGATGDDACVEACPFAALRLRRRSAPTQTNPRTMITEDTMTRMVVTGLPWEELEFSEVGSAGGRVAPARDDRHALG
jgi:ferredoxin